MLSRLKRPFGLAFAAGLALVLLPDPAGAQVVVKVSDTVNFRFGFQLQTWAEWLQDPVSEGYQQGFKIRRVRVLLGGNLAKNVSFFWESDNPNLGNSLGTATKSLGTGYVTVDAFMEWKPFSNDQFIFSGGKFLPPITRNSLQSTSQHLSWDAGTFTFLQNAPLQGESARDLGFQIKSYLVKDHLELRGAILDGFRAPANTGGAGSRNSYRTAGRLVYNFLDAEDKGYVPRGFNFGRKKIVAIGGGFDTQGSYNAYGGDFMIDWPFGPGDAKTGRDTLTAHADFIHFDGGCDLNPAGTARLTNCLIPALAPQNEVFTDVGYYFHTVNIQPFLRFEWNGFEDDIDQGRDSRRYGGGFNWYVTPAAQNMKITVGYERIVPKTKAATAKVKNTNHFLVQFQIVYF